MKEGETGLKWLEIPKEIHFNNIKMTAALIRSGRFSQIQKVEWIFGDLCVFS